MDTRRLGPAFLAFPIVDLDRQPYPASHSLQLHVRRLFGLHNIEFILKCYQFFLFDGSNEYAYFMNFDLY